MKLYKCNSFLKLLLPLLLTLTLTLTAGSTNVPEVELSDGNRIPILGIGTWQMGSDSVVRNRIKDAVNIGYRHIDTALIYGNERAIGRAIRDLIRAGKIKREDLFITSKVWNTYHSRPKVIEGIKLSLKNLGTDYLDLALVHWPTAWREGESYRPVDSKGNIASANVELGETWKGMEDALGMNLTRSIGVSNFNHIQLQKIMNVAKVKPVINQVESHPFLNQQKLLNFARDHNITLTAYSLLARGSADLLRNDKTMKAIADAHNKTTAQVAIRYQVDRGVVAIPKSSNAKRIAENFNVFDFALSDEEIERINAINKNLRIVDIAGNEDHPEYPFKEEF